MAICALCVFACSRIAYGSLSISRQRLDVCVRRDVRHAYTHTLAVGRERQGVMGEAYRGEERREEKKREEESRAEEGREAERGDRRRARGH